jgi:hypothetical protein
MKKSLLTLMVVVALAGCQNRDTGKTQVDQIAFPPPPASPEAAADLAVADPGAKSIESESQGNQQAITEKKIVKEGEVSFETGNLVKARQALMQRLKQLGGYVDGEQEFRNNEQERKEYLLKLRIPAQNFEKFLTAVNETADRIDSKNIRTKDVTTEYIDVTTRLNNQKLLENRYKALLQKAAKMSDILEVESKLSEIRTQVEATQGQLNYLNKQVAYSSLDVTFFTQGSTDKNEGSGFAYKLKMAWRKSWTLLQEVFFGLITVWPLIIVLLIVWFVTKSWRKSRLNKSVKS